MKKLSISIVISAMIGVVMIIIAMVITRNNENNTIRYHLQNDIDDFASVFTEQVHLSQEVLIAILGLYKDSEFVSRDEFKEFAELELKDHLSI